VGVVRSAAGVRAVERTGATARLALLEAGALASAFRGCSVVVHLAQIGTEREGQTFDVVNVQGTRQVIAAARGAGVPRVVLLSGLGVARYGLAPRSTNRYFLSKLAAELELFRSDREAVVFRPSYIVGPGDGLITALLRDLTQGEVRQPGDGSYRVQPIAVSDAAAAILAAARTPAPGTARGRDRHRVFNLVGPEPISYRRLIERVAAQARVQGRPAGHIVREIPMAEAENRAVSGDQGGGLSPEELDCLLCDEVADPRPLEKLLGRALTQLGEAVAIAVQGSPAGSARSERAGPV